MSHPANCSVYSDSLNIAIVNGLRRDNSLLLKKVKLLQDKNEELKKDKKLLKKDLEVTKGLVTTLSKGANRLRYENRVQKKEIETGLTSDRYLKDSIKDMQRVIKGWVMKSAKQEKKIGRLKHSIYELKAKLLELEVYEGIEEHKCTASV